MEKLEQLYEGKAKKVFATDDPALYIVEYKDDATAFNGLKKGTIQGKGIINNQMSNRLMAYLEKQGVPTHYVEELNQRAGAQGIGRVDLIEDRLVGIKSRELYEAPGAIALITAHEELENMCLEREQHRIKRDIDKRWAELVYDAQWFSPAVKSLNAFINDTQQYVNGEIRMVLHGGRAVVVGRRSDSSLYDYNLATYDSGDTFDQNASNGFIEIYGLPTKVAAARDVKFGNGIEVPDNDVE